MRKLVLFSALALSLALHTAQADDSVRAAQELLKSEGFYTGPADGEFNDATKAAVRRYQIRNQLEPTGELTPETMSALNKAGQSAPAEAPAPQAAPPVPSAPLATPPPYAQPPGSVPRPPEDDALRAPNAHKGIPLPPPGQPGLAGPSDPAYAGLYARTPYEHAPAEVQREMLRKAQAIFSARGVYRGAVNGLPGPETEEALLRFQAARGLPRTGRLDIDTLAELHLLPVSRLPLRPHGPGEPHPPGGAVRGVPLD